MILSTSIPKLDELLGGGLRKSSATLLLSTPGIKDLQFAQQIAYARLLRGDMVVYLINNKKPIFLRKIFREYDWDITLFEKRKQLLILDIYQKILDKASLDDLQSFILHSLKNIQKDALVVIDSLSSFIGVYGAHKKTLNFIKLLINSRNLTFVAILTNWLYKHSILSEIKSFFQCVVELKAIERDIILRNYFTVSKAQWIKNLHKQEILFDVVSPGGVKEYMPKILVTGPFNAGKSTFTHAISARATSVDRLGTTVALDYGHVNYKGYSADVFGTPGQTRFDPLLEMLGHKAVGLFLVLDSSKPESFARAQEMINLCSASRLPYVVIANKQDLPGALSVLTIRKRLSLPKSIAIVPCVAIHNKGVGKALDVFFKEVGSYRRNN